MRGIDVSNNNGVVNWPDVAKQGIGFAYAKATEGVTFKDGQYAANRRGAESHSIEFGAYHFFSPGEDAAAQAAFFLDVAKPTQAERRPVLDYESLPAIAGPAEEFVTAMHAKTGVLPMFYSYLAFIHEMDVPASSILAQCPLWLADLTSEKPAAPAPWHEIAVWQQSFTGHVSGVGGFVDLDTGTPPGDKHPIDHYALTHHTKDGHTKHIQTKTPGRWLTLHRRAKRNGRVVITPVRR